jgi:uncharacterized hydrophobic protein (TIGR00271 family)
MTNVPQPRASNLEDARTGIRANAALSAPYMIMNTLAAIVACYGLLENSSAVIIGAMIIAQLLGPITGSALAIMDGDRLLLRNALIAEVVGAACVVVIGYVIGRIHVQVTVGSEIMSRTSPNIMDLIIALAGGAAGAYATVSPRLSAGLVGVAIATALVPPLCSCGICLAHHLLPAGGGAFLLFLTNFVAIQTATALVFWLSGLHHLKTLDRGTIIGSFAPSAVFLTILVIVLGRSFQTSVQQEVLRATAESVLRSNIERGGANLASLTVDDQENMATLQAVVRAPWVITPESCARLQGLVRRKAKRSDVRLRITTVLTRECDANGYLWQRAQQNAADISTGVNASTPEGGS